MNDEFESPTLTKTEMELLTGLINAMETASRDLRTRFGDLKTELEARAEHVSAQADAYEGDDDTVHEALVDVAVNIGFALEEDLGSLDGDIADTIWQWQEHLKWALGLDFEPPWARLA